MKQLALFLLKLVLRLLLFSLTGRWVQLGRDAPPLPRAARKKQAAPRPARTFAPERKAARTRPSRARIEEHAFAQEGTYRDPESAVREGGPARAPRIRTAPMVTRRRAPASLRAALSDPRVVRDALAFEAALGVRGRRR